jgi:hypothetical protein
MLENRRPKCNGRQGSWSAEITHLAFGRRKVVRKEWLDSWMEANKTALVTGSKLMPIEINPDTIFEGAALPSNLDAHH